MSTNLAKFSSLTQGKTVNYVALKASGKGKPDILHQIISMGDENTSWVVMDAKGAKPIASLRFNPLYGLTVRKATEKTADQVVSKVLGKLSEEVFSGIEDQGSIFLAICAVLYDMLNVDPESKTLFDPAKLTTATPEDWWRAFKFVAKKLKAMVNLSEETSENIKKMFINYMQSNSVDILSVAPVDNEVTVTLEAEVETLTLEPATEDSEEAEASTTGRRARGSRSK